MIVAGVDIAWGADLTADHSTWTWTEHRSKLLDKSSVRITRGAPDEAAQHQPAEATFSLNNTTGDFTPDFATGAYYPNVVRDTPVRAWVEVDSAWLDGRATTPDAAALDITGDIFVAIDFDSNPVEFENLASKDGGVGSGQRAWHLYRFADSGFSFRWSEDGAAVDEATFQLPYRRGCIGVYLDVNDGAGGHVVHWYWKNAWTDSWTEVGTSTGAGTTSIFNSSSVVEIGSTSASTSPHRIRHFQIRSGSSTGTIVADLDLTVQTAGDTSFADDEGLTWTVTRGEVTNQEVRFFGFASEFKPYWPVGKIAQASPVAFCDVTASGILRRLRQGATAQGPALRRTIPTYSPIGYWPLEDGRNATFAASALADGKPAKYVGGTFTPAGNTDQPAGSDPLLEFPGPLASSGVVGTLPSSSTGTWAVAVLYYADDAPASEGRFLDVRTSTSYLWRITYGPANVVVYLYNGSTVIDSTSIAVGPDVTSGWQWLVFNADQDGADVDWSIAWHNVGGSIGTSSDTFTSVSLGSPASFTLSGETGWAAGHLCFFEAAVTADSFPADAWAGERTGERLARLATEADIDADVYWSRDLGSLMGSQPTVSLPDAMEDCATAEVGILSERIDRPGLVFQIRDVRYNHPVVELSARDLTPNFRPALDDLDYVNDVTVERPDGSFAHASDDTLPARYERKESMNVQADADLPDAANWLLHLGTWPGMRVPSFTVDLLAQPTLIDKVRSLIPGDVVRITDLPPQFPAGDLDLVIQGWDEKIAPFAWSLTFNCSPAGPWSVAVLEDEILGRADTAGSELDGAITSGATSIEVATTAGPVWIDSTAYSSEFPFDIRVGGEVMTVTACTDTASPQTFTVTRSVNGVVKAHADGTAVSLAHPMRLAL